MKTCQFCSEEIQDNARKCKHCGEWLEGIMVDIRNRLKALKISKSTTSKNAGFIDYKDLPWYRKSDTSSWLVLLGAIFFPFLWIVLYALITGNIYYDERLRDGSLRKWSLGNKVIAWFLVFPSVLLGLFGLTLVFALILNEL